MKHFFIDETTGKLFVIPEMPEEPDFKALKKDPIYGDYKFFTGVTDSDVYRQYKEALHSAKAKAVEVENQEEVARKLGISGTYSKAVLNTIYSLDCEVEIKNRCTNKYYISGCANETCWDLEECQAKVTLAFITFNTEEKKEEETRKTKNPSV
jgi:hypothetical protein